MKRHDAEFRRSLPDPGLNTKVRGRLASSITVLRSLDGGIDRSRGSARLFDDAGFRAQALTAVRNAQVRRFWEREYDRFPVRLRAEAIAPIQNKVGEFLVNPILQPILSRSRGSFRLRDIMDGGKIFLVNLAKGKIGEDTAALLGTLLVTQMGVAALSRSDTYESERRDFYLYADEFPSFTTSAFADMLAEMRKYRLCLTLAHQHLGQLNESVRDAVLGNVGTTISFRISMRDAEFLGKEFLPELGALWHARCDQGTVRLPRSGCHARPRRGPLPFSRRLGRRWVRTLK